MKRGVLLLAHGAPERIEDVPEYLSYVRGGQPVSPHVLQEVVSRYEAKTDAALSSRKSMS